MAKLRLLTSAAVMVTMLTGIPHFRPPKRKQGTILYEPSRTSAISSATRPWAHGAPLRADHDALPTQQRVIPSATILCLRSRLENQVEGRLRGATETSEATPIDNHLAQACLPSLGA